jgi:hypothetical protein
MSNTQKIINTPFPNDMEIGIEELTVTYIQNPDTNDNSEHYQRITLSTETSCADEMPYYVNVSIPNFDDGTPGHWSLDLTENFTPILEDFKKRLETREKEQ